MQLNTELYLAVIQLIENNNGGENSALITREREENIINTKICEREKGHGLVVCVCVLQLEGTILGWRLTRHVKNIETLTID